MSEKILEEKNRVIRHSALELAEHWTIALSGLILLLSGLFELPMAARYGITAIPGLSWSGDFITSLYIHYAASVVFIAAAFFHLFSRGLRGEKGLIPRKGDLRASVAVIGTFFGRGEEPPFEKYLPEQRLAYLGMAVIIAVLILSGLIKTYKNLFAPDLSHHLVLWATWLHNIFFVLFVLAFAAHIGAILLKPNRPMARGIFTGAVRLDYARHRHPLWIAGLESPKPPIPPASLQETVVTPGAAAAGESGGFDAGAGAAAEENPMPAEVASPVQAGRKGAVEGEPDGGERC